MRMWLLQEMKQIRQDHADRTTKIEESVEVFEHMVKELHASNQEKAKEMDSYQKKLSQIGAATAKTASQVDDLSTSVNHKVDKLRLSMKSFINVMTDVVCNGNDGTNNDQQKKNLLELSKLLEDDVNGSENNTAEMEVENSDEELEETQQNLKQEPSPSASDALGGEGCQK